MSMFEVASRKKLRFKSGKGLLCVEDLWDLSTESLDSMAISVNSQLKEFSQESFIPNKRASSKSVDLELQLEILKHVIQTKVTESNVAKLRSENRQRKSMLQDILARKEEGELMNKSPEELRKMMEELSS